MAAIRLALNIIVTRAEQSSLDLNSTAGHCVVVGLNRLQPGGTGTLGGRRYGNIGGAIDEEHRCRGDLRDVWAVGTSGTPDLRGQLNGNYGSYDAPGLEECVDGATRALG